MSNSNESKKLESIDYDILRILSEDSRKSFREIGRELDKSPTTIAKHIDELIEKKIIKNFCIDIDYEKMGYDFIALIELTISKGKMLEVEKDIANNPNIFGVYDVTGEYDAFILARFKTRSEVSKLVKEINSYDYVVRTNTHLILNIVKEGTSFSDLVKF